MKFTFDKYHGTGNDFILIDQRNQVLSLSAPTIARLCNRHFGIGADGLMLLTAMDDYDFGMRYFNANGHESTMCGNGGRCITAYAQQLGIIQQRARFLAIDGEHQAEILVREKAETRVKLRMSDVESMVFHSFPIENQPLTATKYNPQAIATINTGSPHLLLFMKNVDTIDVVTEGRAWREYPAASAGGVNVNFVQINNDHSLSVRTYERGVEDETLSCGTGATAAALVFSRIEKPSLRNPVVIHTKGGTLSVTYAIRDGQFTNIWLEGLATFVFRGEINLTQ